MEQKNDGSAGRARHELNTAIAKQMALQEGLISFSQLKAIGASSKAVRSRVASQRLVPRATPPRRRPPSRSVTRSPAARQSGSTTSRGFPSDRQVFGTHAGPLSLEARRWFGLLSAPQPAWLTHLTVCELLGLDTPRRSPIHVVHLGSAWRAPQGVVAHRTTSMPPHDTAMYGRRGGTILARALQDAAADVTATTLDDLLDSPVRLGVYSGEDVLRVLTDRPTLPETQRLALAVGRLDATSGTFRSNFERRTMRLVERSRRIPRPVVNVLVEGYRPDLWWLRTRAIVECDGRDYHRSPGQIASDEAREAILRARGFNFLRLRWAQVVYEEAQTLARIEEFVLANLEAPVPGLSL